MAWNHKDLISIKDLDKQDILHILDVAKRMGPGYTPVADGKILATLFFEPSTRTRLSFEAAMHRLGGNVIGFADSSNTSVAKGETLSDTIRIVDGYADIIVIRHPREGSAKTAAEAASIPVVNGGDGINEHPTQTLLDLYTIQETFGKFDGLTVAFVGDLKFGRTVHSLSYALSHFDTKLCFVAPESLRMPEHYVSMLQRKGIEVTETADLKSVLPIADVLYVTRIQKERFMKPEDYDKVKGYYRLGKEILQDAKEGMKILHPLPRVDEINLELDEAEQSIYFKQAHNGIPVRKALLAMLLGLVDDA
ncbi:aspartate carbamoyltransferase [Candidatus Woesearchaeota archaeon CG_4_10_14_0_2_um_filter_57_5]|nr:MAG: aspartate carbamoyltransferase [Candidatus Woesearchaeota archaeon CG1_02_57_44]PIN68100.1 MAG: aspartate carbamoyltransferase [Candidatus Woesearchaeota archaeon CG11_big_fil_rev_8_21_14_0_20_57_5]PIZ51370.1 MAG: aspartate carbamoyltransferase [Candidatus Woesearchaeota archaeon CG_4_10_14_0_2_um_filter_57_5]